MARLVNDKNINETKIVPVKNLKSLDVGSNISAEIAVKTHIYNIRSSINDLNRMLILDLESIGIQVNIDHIIDKYFQLVRGFVFINESDKKTDDYKGSWVDAANFYTWSGVNKNKLEILGEIANRTSIYHLLNSTVNNDIGLIEEIVNYGVLYKLSPKFRDVIRKEKLYLLKDPKTSVKILKGTIKNRDNLILGHKGQSLIKYIDKMLSAAGYQKDGTRR